MKPHPKRDWAYFVFGLPLMPAPSVAYQLRVILDDLESKPEFDQTDPDLIALKRILRARIAQLEAEAAKHAKN